LRYKRISERHRIDDPDIEIKIEKRDEREKKFGINEVIRKADYLILNNSTIDDLKIRTRNLVLNLIMNY